MDDWLGLSHSTECFHAPKRRKVSVVSGSTEGKPDDWLCNVVDNIVQNGAIAFDRDELQVKLSHLLKQDKKHDQSSSLQFELLDLLGAENLSFIDEVMSTSKTHVSSSTAPDETRAINGRLSSSNSVDLPTQLCQKPNKTAHRKESRDRVQEDQHPSDVPTQTYSKHSSYPFPIAKMSLNIQTQNCKSGSRTCNRPDLDMQYYHFLSHSNSLALFRHLRHHLPFYRVKYEAHQRVILTPRYTTVFGLDISSIFNESGKVSDATNPTLSIPSRYRCSPRPIPQCLQLIKEAVEELSGELFTHVLVNFYSGGQDSISYHSDDESFLGPLPCIASLSLGARRDFLMKHKDSKKDADVLKLTLESGDMLVMRGTTQSRWLHSVPKRKSSGNRMNITFRKAILPAGTMNYVRYNIGTGPVYRWDGKNMVCQGS